MLAATVVDADSHWDAAGDCGTFACAPAADPPPSQFLTQASGGATSEAGDRFGRSLATGDFDGDNFMDLAVGVPLENTDGATDTGMVIVFYGTASGLSTTKVERFTQNSVVTATNEDGDRFGSALAAADFDADGFDDLAIGVPYEDTDGETDTGLVAVMFGSNQGLLPSNSEAFTQNSVVTASNEEGDQFGSSLAAGDFDADGFADLAIGVPYEDTDGMTDTGMVAVMFGSSQGLLPSNSEAFTQNSVVTASNEDGDQFGSTLAVGDFDNDGYDDLAVGVPYEDTDGATDTGLIAILFGSDAGLLPSTSEAFTQNSLVTSTNEDGDRFGSSLAVGDFDGDSFDDLAVGVPGEDTTGTTSTGMVGVFFGSAAGLLPSVTEAFTQNSTHGDNEDFDQAGFALTAGNFDGDPYDDLIVGVPFENEFDETDNGTILALFGDSSGLLPARSYWLGQSNFGGIEESSDRFGYVLVSGDFDNDGLDDVAVGTPFEDIGGNDSTGAVYVGELEPALPNLTADSSIVINRDTGEVLGATFPDRRRAQASTTKIMTGLLAVEAINDGDVLLTDTVTVSSNVLSAGGSSMNLAAGDRLSLQDLLHGMLLPSGNDAAVAVAEFVGGSVNAFVQRMNDRADELGLTNSNFVNPHGRDPEDLVPGCSGNQFDVPACAHYSSARDLASLAAEALDDPIFAAIVDTVRYTTTTWTNGVGTAKNATLCTTNRLLRTPADGCGTSVTYPGAYGVKTGTTDLAGSVLVSAAANACEDLIAVVMGSNSNGDPAGDRYTDSTTALDFGFERSQTSDLMGHQLLFSPLALVRGNRVDLDFAIRNGCSDAAGSFTVDFYLSIDDRLRRSQDKRLEAFTVDGLVGDTTTAFQHSVQLPDPRDSFWPDPREDDGRYYVFMDIDAAGNVSDRDRSNNNNTGIGLDIAELHIAPTSGDLPTAAIAEVSPNVRLAAVNSISIEFSETISGFDLRDLRLTRDSKLVALPSAASLETSDNTIWKLSGLDRVTAAPGRYELRLLAEESQIINAAGFYLASDAQQRWQNIRLPGDADGDGGVDGSDFNIWNRHKFQSGTDWTTGDFNLDESTDASDFNIWFDNRFTSVALAAGADAGTVRNAQPRHEAHVVPSDVVSSGTQPTPTQLHSMKSESQESHLTTRTHHFSEHDGWLVDEWRPVARRAARHRDLFDRGDRLPSPPPKSVDRVFEQLQDELPYLKT